MPKMGEVELIPDGRALFAATYTLTIPGVDCHSTSTGAYVDDVIYYFPIKVVTPITVDQVVVEVTAAAGAGEKGRAAIYEADIDWQPGALVVASAEFAIDANVVVTTAIAATVLQGGRYLLALTLDGNATFRTVRGGTRYSGFRVTLGATPCLSDMLVSVPYAALPDPGVAWDTLGGGNVGFEYAVFLRVLTP